MAKRQSRRSISVSRATYDAITEAAKAAGLSGSEYVTQLVRNAVPTLPPQIHERTRLATVTRLDLIPDVEPAKPRSVITAPRRVPSVPPGSTCANCIDAPAVTRGRVDVAGPEFNLCADCVLPNDRVEDARGRWKRKASAASGGGN